MEKSSSSSESHGVVGGLVGGGVGVHGVVVHEDELGGVSGGVPVHVVVVE